MASILIANPGWKDGGWDEWSYGLYEVGETIRSITLQRITAYTLTLFTLLLYCLIKRSPSRVVPVSLDTCPDQAVDLVRQPKFVQGKDECGNPSGRQNKKRRKGRIQMNRNEKAGTEYEYGTERAKQ